MSERTAETLQAKRLFGRLKIRKCEMRKYLLRMHVDVHLIPTPLLVGMGVPLTPECLEAKMGGPCGVQASVTAILP